MDWINENWQELVGIVGGVVIAARIIVKLTPTPKDDAFLAKIITLLKHLGLYIPVLLALLLLPACSITIDPQTGKPVVGADQASIDALTAKAVQKINEDLARESK